MAWTAIGSPYFTVGEVVTATKMNALSNNLRFLKGTDGAIQLDNDLGIGTATPAANIPALGRVLKLVPSSGQSGMFQEATVSGSDAGVGQMGWINTAATGSDKRIAFIIGGRESSDDSGTMRFVTRNAGSVATEAMRINRLGYLGVGTINPTAKLDVAENTGHMAFAARSGIVGTTVTILPAGTVTKGCVAIGVADNGVGNSAVWPNTLMTTAGGGLSVTLGASTLQLNTYGDGSVGFIRSAGTATCSAAVILVYI